MDLQWLLVARGYTLNDGTMDVSQIFQRAVVSGGPPFKVPMSVLAKVKSDPLHAGEETTFSFRVEHLETGTLVLELELPYTYPNLDAWLQGAGAYIDLDLANVELPTVGEYTASILHKGDLLASESFVVENGYKQKESNT
ncbi:MAG: hypothetical protein IH872_09930 [Chloroflexi bacterium]|nr:hypothetical protein [Chloroflexota bacterium]